MARRIIQAPAELIMFVGDQVSFKMTIVDSTETENLVDLTSATAITLKAFEFLDDTVPAVDLTGVVEDGPAGLIRFDFLVATTANLTPQTYIYRVGLTLDGDPLISHKNQLTIRSKLA